MRGAGGYYYDRIYNNLFENIRFNPPFFAVATLGAQAGVAGSPPVGPLASPGVYGVPFTNPRAFVNFAALPQPRHMDQNLVSPYTQQAVLGVQWGFAKDFVLEVDGTYTGGRKLTGIQDINTYNGRVACTSARAACVAAFNAHLIPTTTLPAGRVNVGFAADNFRTNAFGSNYYGLQTSLTRRLSNGLLFNANYTWSHALDSFSDAFNNARGNIARPTDNFNQQLDKGSADFDVKHCFVFSGNYDLPFLKSNRWLGGWFVNGIVTYQRGVPIPIYMGTGAGDLNRDGYNTDRPLITGDPYVHGTSPADGWLTPTVGGVNASFAIPTCPTNVNFGLWCDSPTGRNTLRSPGFSNTDLGVGKNFRLTESAKLRFQANFFDVFNHPNFDVPTGNVFGSGTFGRSTRTYGDLGGHRITQLALRIDF